MPVIHNPRLRHTLWGVVLVFVLLEFGRTTLGKFSIVEGDSMSPTFTAGDFVHARRSYVKVRGDVVVFSDDSQRYAIKRIVGLPGEAVTLYQGEVYINGRRLFEPYLLEASSTFRNNQKNEPAATWRLTADQYFVMGDHRYGSCDSRHYGPIQRREIHGVVELPENSPRVALLEITLADSMKEQSRHPMGLTPNRNQVLLARRPVASSFQLSAEAAFP